MTDNTKEDPRVLTQEECQALVDGLSDWFPHPPNVVDGGTDRCYGLWFSHSHYVGEGLDLRVDLKILRDGVYYLVDPLMLAEYEDARGFVSVDGTYYTPERVAAVKLAVINAIKGSVDGYATRLERNAEESRRAADLLCAHLVGKKEVAGD